MNNAELFADFLMSFGGTLSFLVAGSYLYRRRKQRKLAKLEEQREFNKMMQEMARADIKRAEDELKARLAERQLILQKNIETLAELEAQALIRRAMETSK